MTDRATVVEINGVSKQFGQTTALQGIELERQPGELLAEPLARTHPGVRPRDALRAVLVTRQLLELAKLGDGTSRFERHRGRA